MSDEKNIDEAVEKRFGHKNDMFETNSKNKIKHIIGVASGKGGVGKSMVTSLLAISLAKSGYKVGILDADITGPSIPKGFGVPAFVDGTDELMYPQISKLGIKIMSINLLFEDPTLPVLWRGPMIGSALKQFYCDVLWDELDFLLIDMPPGTGDVPMTIYQSLPIDGVVIVSTPQDLVKMIVGKAVNMCKQMNVNILGLVENMSYMECPCCGEILYPFGESKLDEIADFYNIVPLGSLPINPDSNKYVDNGTVEDLDVSRLSEIIEKLLAMLD
ncbi:MAG: Mrp/NBP35 family ATP-binding protein [Acholeplasmatales bacterium]|nr:Mrp/NBP35 family ATP-binding protein [Acholeplasmatales bacterium]